MPVYAKKPTVYATFLNFTAKYCIIFVRKIHVIKEFNNMQNRENNLIQVLTLGVFHFNFPNLDRYTISDCNQIDVLQESYQEEIHKIVEKLAKFGPTAIAIEQASKNQDEVNKAYNKYLDKEYTLSRNEHEQIGFRLAEKLNLGKLYCVDEWGDFDADVNNLISNEDKRELNKFTDFVESSPDKNKEFNPKQVFKEKGILAELRELNNPYNIKKSLGNYLINGFKYENKEKDFLGVKFETGRWFSRNLKIFRNIQRIPLSSNDKILIIYGAGHLNLLNLLFEVSPEFKLIDIKNYI